MALDQLTNAAWVWLAIAAVLIGFSKTAIGGVSLISIGIFAHFLPARASTGVVLLCLIVGDVVAVWTYAKHANWRHIKTLAPWVVAGMAVGIWFLFWAGDTQVRRAIGAVLLVMVLIAMRNKVRPTRESRADLTVVAGIGSGFTSMVANAGAGIMSLHLLRQRLPVLEFMGTISWLFFLLNLTKVPFSVGLGLIDQQTLVIVGLLSPAVLLGTWLGRLVIAKISLAGFEWAVLGFTLLAAVNLLS